MQCYKINNGIFHRTKTKYSKICMEANKIPNSLSNLKKENWSWRNQANFRLYYKAMVIKTV